MEGRSKSKKETTTDKRRKTGEERKAKRKHTPRLFIVLQQLSRQ